MRPLVLSCATAALLAGTAVSAFADDFLQQEGDLWRASKLAGVNIYGPDSKKVGDITDVLMGKDGKATYVVVGVGGFLGIGEKNVAIPYDKVTFSQEPMTPPATSGNAPAGAMAPASTPMTGGSAPGTAPAALGPNAPAGVDAPAVATATGNTGSAGMAPAGPPAGGTMPMPMPARSTAYPDHGTITYTVEQLKAAPTFSFAK